MPPSERESLLIRCWMTHDAMWFFHCLQECGIERTNRINKAAVRSMATVEIKRIQKALGIEPVQTLDDVKALVEGALDLVKADFMDFTCTFPSRDVMRWEMRRCFAYEGIRKMGVIEEYQCGIFDRIEGWLDGLGVKYDATPQVTGCLMHTEGMCVREFRVWV